VASQRSAVDYGSSPMDDTAVLKFKNQQLGGQVRVREASSAWMVMRRAGGATAVRECDGLIFDSC